MTAVDPKETFIIRNRITAILCVWASALGIGNAAEERWIELICERGEFVNRERNIVYASDTIFRLSVAEDGSRVETDYVVADEHQEVEVYSIVREDTIYVAFEFEGAEHSLMINRHTGTLYADESNAKGFFHGEGRCVTPNKKF